MADNRLVQEVYSRNGRTRYYAADTEPNEVFNAANTQEKKSADYSFLSAESIGSRLDEKRKEREDFKDTYLINLDDKQRSLLNVMLEQSENPEEQIYKFATAVKYAEGFNIPLDFAYENLDAINRNWLGVGIEAHKGNFKAVADSFEIGINTLKMSTAGRDLMKAEGLSDEREIQAALEYLNDLENESTQLQDKIPRNWLVNLLKSGANTVPYSAAVLAPSLAASAVNPALGTAVGFGVSAELQTGLEYWELRKAGVKKDIARNVALLSGGLQAVVETALGHVAGVTGKGLGADKVVSKLLTRLNAKGTFGRMGKALLFYGADVFEEGIEEAIQELVSAGGKELASVLQGEGVETDTAVEVAEKTWESFKGGLAGSLLLGVPGAVKFAHMNKTEATALQKDAISTPSEEAFIRKNKDNVVFEGMTEEDTKEELHNIFDAQKAKRERFQRSKINDYDEWLSSEARVEGEAVIDEKGNTVYETDEQGKAVLEADENGEVHKKVKRYEAASDVVRHNDRLYIAEGYRKENESGIVQGEYIAGDPTRETDDNDYGHIYYTQDTNKNTVKITGVEMMSDRYNGIIKEFVRDFTEKFAGSRIIWEPKGETLQAVKNQLIAENPTGKQNGLQYFADIDTAEEKRADIKLYERLKETMPQLSETERHTAVAVFDALAQGAGMDAQTYLNTYYADEILTNKEPANMQKVAAQQDIEKSNIKGATDFTELANDIKALVYVSEKADFSTFVHEVSHVARRTIQGELLQKAEKAFGVIDGKWTRSQEENFAQGFEQYLRDGVAPTQELKTVFQKAAEFLARIYKNLQELLHINDEIRQVYDELLGGQKSVLKDAEQSTAVNSNIIKEFGQNYTEYYHKGIEAIEKVLQEKKGQVAGAFNRPDVGDIDVVWGNEKIGLEKIINKHLNDFIDFGIAETGISNGIDEIVRNGDLTEKNGIKTIVYKKNGKTYKVGLSQGWNGKGNNKWIITAYEANMGSGKGKTLSAVADFNSSQTPEETATTNNTIAQDTDAVNSEESKNEEVKASYDKAANAARYAGRLSDEELKDMLFQTEQTKEETQGMEAVRKQYEGTDKWLKAPNGNDTRLSEKQWLQVRTDSFKKWFGDWENNPESASKVVDENGEPKILYHQTRNSFDIFDIKHQGAGTNDSETPYGIFMKEDKANIGLGPIHMPLFTNIRNPLYFRNRLDIAKWLNENVPGYKVAAEAMRERLKELNERFEEEDAKNDKEYNKIYTEYTSGKITKKEFDTRITKHLENDFLDYAIDEMNKYENTTSAELKNMLDTYMRKTEYDGMILDEDTGSGRRVVHTIIAFNPNQIKSAVDNKGTFDSTNDNIYFQTEADFYDESAQAINKEVIKDDIEKIIIGEDVDVGRFYRMFYGNSEQRALYDKAFRDAITPELEEALKKDTKDEKVKNDTFIKIMQNKEVLRDFMKQYISTSQSAGPTADMIHNLSSAAVFATLSYQITNGKAFTEKQQKLAMNALMQNVEGFRNVFARLNGYEALISLTKAEKAWTQSWAEATFNGQVAQVEQSEKKQGQAKSRSETQDALFLEEMEDDEKLSSFLKEASRIAFFNFDEFEAQDESDAQYRDELKRKQERIENVMRNQAWKSQLINVYHGKDLSDYAIKNIRGQMNNAVRTYRSLYADIMERQDMRVKDADSTDEIIKTKLRSRKQSALKLDELRLENMSAKEKELLIQALDNEEMEQNIRKGYITLDDVGKIEQLVKAKNQNIKSLENKIQQMHEDTLSDKSQIGKLEQQLRDEKISRRVLADTIRARDVALKAVMRRINLKACNVDEAQSIAAVQWYLRGNVQKALNATVDKAEPVIREAYALWKTSPEYRQTLSRMLSRKKEWGQLRNLFEYKDIGEWTADDKKLAARLVPERNKFFSLGLYNRTEKNFYDMKTAAMSSEQIAQEAAATLGETLAARLTHRPLKQWTVDELIELAQKIDEVYKDGRKKYLAKKAALRAEAEGIRMDGISAFRNAKNWRGKDLYKEIPAAWSEEEKSKTGGIGSFLRKAKYVAMRPYAFIEMLDGGRQGTLYDLFEYEQRECNAVFRKNTDEKIDSFYSFLKDHKLDLSELDTKIVFDRFYENIHNPLEGKPLTLTVKEILGVYLASFDERSREAVQYGNFAEQKERDFAQKGDGKTSLDVSTERRLNTVVKKAEELLAKDKRLSSLVTYLQKKYKEQGERLQKHDKEVNNKITEIVEHYFPMQRLDVSGEEDARQTQKKIQGEFATGTRHGIAKGQTKERTDISGGYQKPIKLDVISTYLQSVEANERLFAYDKYAQKLNRVVKGYGSERFIKDLETTYGREAVSYLNKQVNTIIDPTAGRVYSSTDKVLRVLRGNTAAAYLGWKLSGIIKQGITSPAPFLQYVNPINYTKAAVDWTIHHDKMEEFVYSRSILMKNRSFDMMQTIADELAQNAKTKAGKAITQAQQLGMQGLEWIDRTCVAPGWLAAYREEEARLRKKNASLEKPLSDNDIDIQASRYADDVLVRTQPSGRAEELAPLFREGGEALRMLLQFQSSLNVIYNNVRHDLPNAIRNKQYGRAAGIITGYALAGILVGAVTEGFGSDDDDDKDKIKRGVYYAFTQYTDSVPVINGIVDSVSEKLITGKTRYRGSTSIYAAVEKLAQGTAALSDADIQKAAARYAEAAGLTLGLPTSGTKEALYAAEQAFTGDIPSTLWGRR